MAISTADIQLYGQKQGGSDKRELFYELWWGMFLKMFETKAILRSRIWNESLEGADSKSFHVYGSAEATEYAYGDNLLVTESTKLVQIPKARVLVEADMEVQCATLTPDIDKLWSPNGAMESAIVADRLASGCARTFDLRALSMLIQNAAAADTLTQSGSYLTKLEAATAAGCYAVAPTNADFKGGALFDANIATSGAAFEEDLWKVKTTFDLNDVPAEGRVCVVSPDVARLLPSQAGVPVAYSIPGGGSESKVVRAFTSELNGTGGNYLMGIIPPIAGFEIIVHNFMYKLGKRINATQWCLSGAASGTPGNTKYAPNAAASLEQVTKDPDSWTDSGAAGNIGDAYNRIKAVCFQREAVGCLWSKEPWVETQRKVETSGDLIVSKYVAGLGKTRPECSFYIATGEATTAEANV